MTTELHTLVGAYALDALTGPEHATFERHLGDCLPCSAELDEFRATAARLAEPFAAEPPEHLRGQVLLAARRTVQARPPLAEQPTHRTGRRWGGRRAGLTGLLAAAALVAVAGIGGLWWDEYRENQQLAEQQDQIQAIMTAEDREISPNRDDAPLQVVSSASLDQAVVMVERLPDIDEENSYELWALDAEGDAQSLGALPESAESGTQLVEGLGDAAAVAVTEEEAGGSPTGQPTTKPVKSVSLI